MTEIIHPIIVVVENINIQVQDGIGNVISDNVRSNEEITISNKDIMRLKVKGGSIPEQYILYQNFPNPFNPSTKIKFNIPRLSFVTIKVYDILGNEVVTLISDEFIEGKYEVDLNSYYSASKSFQSFGNLASGIYFYQLQATPEDSQSGTFIQTRKMILIK